MQGCWSRIAVNRGKLIELVCVHVCIRVTFAMVVVGAGGGCVCVCMSESEPHACHMH